MGSNQNDHCHDQKDDAAGGKNIDLDKTVGRVATQITKMMNLKMTMLLIRKRIKISINKIHVL